MNNNKITEDFDSKLKIKVRELTRRMMINMLPVLLPEIREEIEANREYHENKLVEYTLEYYKKMQVEKLNAGIRSF